MNQRTDNDREWWKIIDFRYKHNEDAINWCYNNAGKRFIDWRSPTSGIWLFKDKEMAVLFQLIWC